MNGKVEEFLDGLRAGEPKAVDAANRLLGTLAQHRDPPPLSPRQAEVISLVAAGLSEGEIGIQMGISGYTVREHVRRAKLALGARTKPHMVALWLAWEATQQR